MKIKQDLKNQNNPIISNNEMLTDISPVHPYEGSIYKMYDENITSFDSILDSSDNFNVPSQNYNNINNKNLFTQQIADTKLNSINSYANKEKEKELYKKNKIDTQKNSYNQINSNNNINIINKGVNLDNFNSNNNADNKNLDDMAQKGFVPLSRMEGKVYSKKAQSNTQQYMNSFKKAKTKINLTNKANLNNSSSVIEINYNQNQIDEEGKNERISSKNNSQYSSRNKENSKSNQTSTGTDIFSKKNYKISETLNIDIYKETIPTEQIKGKGSKSKESSLIKEKDNSKYASENSNNGKHYQKIRNIYPFGSNKSKNNSALKKRLNNSNTEQNSYNNTSYNSNNHQIKHNKDNVNTISNMSYNYLNFKEEIKSNKADGNEDNFKNSDCRSNEIKTEKTLQNHFNVNISNETIGKEGQLQTNLEKISLNNEINKNKLIIRGSRIDQTSKPNFKEEINKDKKQEKSEEINNKKTEEQNDFFIPQHKYNTSKDTGFLSITATEDYLDLINLNNTNMKILSDPNNNNLINNMITNNHMEITENEIKKEDKEIIISSEKNNEDVSTININKNNNTNINDITSKLIGFDNNTSRSIFRHDFASIYNPYTSHILSIGGKSDIISRKYSIETNTWSVIREMKVERSDFIALMYKEKRILIMGGKSLNYNGIESVSDTIDLLSTDDHSVVRLDFKLKIPRSNFGAVYHEYRLFVGGGYNGRDALNNFEYFDKKTKKWIDLPKMFNKKKEFSMILGSDNNIYCLGGSDEREYNEVLFNYLY